MRELLWQLYYKTNTHKKNECQYCKNKIISKRLNTKWKRVYLSCGHYINPTKDTIFYKSRIPLTKWIRLIKLFLNSTIDSIQASKILGVSQPTAWRSLMKIRKLFDKKIYKPKGHVQIDELFLGSPAKNSHKQKIMSKDITAYNAYRTWVPRKRNDHSKKKAVVFGLASENGKYLMLDSGIRCIGMAELKSKNIRIFWKYYWSFIINNYVPKNQVIYHDGDPSIDNIIKKIKYESDTVSHNKNEYVKINHIKRKIITTNSVEGMFGRFKRRFKGVQTHSKNHLNDYLLEYSFRANLKHISIKKFINDFI